MFNSKNGYWLAECGQITMMNKNTSSTEQAHTDHRWINSRTTITI